MFIRRPYPRHYKLVFKFWKKQTCPKILLSYAASERLGIIEFKVPYEASTPSVLDTISTTKNVTFSKPVHAEKLPPHNPSNTTPRSVIKNNTFQDQCLQDHYSTTSVAPLQDLSTGVAPFHDHNSKSIASSKDHLSLADVRDIFNFKNNPYIFWCNW